MPVIFSNRQAFHDFLYEHCDSDEGLWITFYKTADKDKLSPQDALLEALSFGWIDGQIKRIDDTTYIKYFKKRSKKSIWSERNKGIVALLIKANRMMPSGLHQVDLAKKDGRWDKADSAPVDFSLDNFTHLLESYPLAHQNYINMGPSVRKTYAMSYYILKKPKSRDHRLKVIIARLEQNQKPM